MFDKYHGIIDLNNFLKDQYNYSYTGSSKQFYEQDFVELEVNGVDATCWFKDQDDSYLFKPLTDPDYNIWGELLSEKFAQKMNIDCATYRVATFNGEKGVITKRMFKNEETLILGSEIFQQFLNKYPYNKVKDILNNDKFLELYSIPEQFRKLDPYDQKRYVFNHLNNLDQVWSILELNKDINSSDTGEIIKGLSKMLLFDLLTLQGDRHPNNWGILQNGDKYRLSPIFDNSTSFGIGYPNLKNKIQDFKSIYMTSKYLGDQDKLDSIVYQARPNFTLTNSNILESSTRLKDQANTVFKDYLEQTSTIGGSYIIEELDSIDEETVPNMIDELEQENEIRMPDDLYFYVTNMFNLNINNLKKVASDYKKGVSSNERSK